MKLLRLHIQDEFRSLYPGFEVHFHRLTEKGIQAMDAFQPFCFAGLNGSGKSNVLEALAAIFGHLEFCVAKFLPESLEQFFERTVSTPDAYELEYLIGPMFVENYSFEELTRVFIKKKKGEIPRLHIQGYPFDENSSIDEIKDPFEYKGQNKVAAAGKNYLPDLVIGYSSGENEILSLPFIKNRLVNFDKYREDYANGIQYSEPETSLIYIDEGMSQAVLLAVLLFEDSVAIKPLRDELGIMGLQSFSMRLNQHALYHLEKDMELPVLDHIKEFIDKFKQCASCWYETESEPTNKGEDPYAILSLDFFVDDAVKAAFRQHFGSSLQLFRFFQVFYELNANIVQESIKEDVYNSKGFYTKNKLPMAAPKNDIFHFLEFKILKEIPGKEEPIALLLRNLSDGEHQFLHTMGICLMLKDRRSLLLLDEPETHFNPAWRAKFVKILNDSITAGSPAGDTSIHLRKDVILTSHSPFIISDCMPSSVLFFNRNKETNLVEAKTARELGLNTYGSSVDYILKNFFNTRLMGEKSREELEQVIEKGSLEELRVAVDYFGESSEKQFIFRKIYEKMNLPKDDSNA